MTATSTFAYDDTTISRLAIPTSERTYDDGGSYARPTFPSSERLNDGGGSYARPSLPGNERAYDDGGSYARPKAPSVTGSTTMAAPPARQPAPERANDDGGAHGADDAILSERLRALGLERIHLTSTLTC
jgi:hypothetical protein